MKKSTTVVLAGALIAGVGAAAFATLAIPTQEAVAVSDPRQEPPIVRLATAARVTGSERGFTGIVGARVLSNLGFRVPGKIVERLVNAGQQVKGEPGQVVSAGQSVVRLAQAGAREAVVQRTRPVILTALAAVLAFIPLTHSVFWGSMAYTLIGGTAVGTVLILLFLPALYVAWFRIKPTADEIHEVSMEEPELRCRATVLPQLGLHPPLWRFIA